MRQTRSKPILDKLQAWLIERRDSYLPKGGMGAAIRYALGANVAALYTIVGTCEAHGVNPFEYLRDVLVRVSSHPTSDIDALLPHRWTLPAATD